MVSRAMEGLGMNKRMKRLVAGTTPAICGAVAVAAFGEKINWPENPAAQPSFQAATRPTAPETQPVVEVIVLPLGGAIRGLRP